jgi:hypothetical protein
MIYPCKVSNKIWPGTRSKASISEVLPTTRSPAELGEAEFRLSKMKFATFLGKEKKDCFL